MQSPEASTKNPKRVASGRKSKSKGNRNERQMAQLFKQWWGKGEWARTPSSGGWATVAVREGFRTCGDIITTATDFPFCIELKHNESWYLEQILINDPETFLTTNIGKWWKQTLDETPGNLLPMLVLRRNHVSPIVIFSRSLSFDRHCSAYGHRYNRFETDLLGRSVCIMSLESLFLIHPLVFGATSHEEGQSSSSDMSQV